MVRGVGGRRMAWECKAEELRLSQEHHQQAMEVSMHRRGTFRFRKTLDQSVTEARILGGQC